jgi:hypothetical protein
MITLDAAAAALRATTYPNPGYDRVTYEIRTDEADFPYVWIVLTAKDALNPGETLDLGVRGYLSPNDLGSVDALCRFMDYRLRRIAAHESQEFFQRDGRPIVDPHASERVTVASTPSAA